MGGFIQVLEDVKVTKEIDRETLIDVARTSLSTKVDKEIAEVLTEVSKASVLCLMNISLASPGLDCGGCCPCCETEL